MTRPELRRALAFAAYYRGLQRQGHAARGHREVWLRRALEIRRALRGGP